MRLWTAARDKGPLIDDVNLYRTEKEELGKMTLEKNSHHNGQYNISAGLEEDSTYYWNGKRSCVQTNSKLVCSGRW